MNYMEAAMAPAEDKARRMIEFQTWGHLYPKPGSVYWGHIDVAFDGHNEYVVVDYDLKNSADEEIGGSPCWYEDSNDWACETCGHGNYGGLEAGFYRFFVRYCRPGDGNKGYEMTETRERVKASFDFEKGGS